MTSSTETFSCPYCGQRFDWKWEMAGRKLMCACGHVLTVPATPPPPVEETTYELEEGADEPPPAGKLQLDSSGQEVHPVPVLEYRRATLIDQARFSDQARDKFRDVWAPIGIIVLGVFVLVAEVVGYSQALRIPLPALAGNVTIRLVWDIVMTLVAGMVLGWLLDAGLGEFHIAVLKLTAIAAGRFAVAMLISIPSGKAVGDMCGFAVTLPLFIASISYLFDFDFHETLITFVLITFMRWISYFGLVKLLG